ncbi:MAG: hypothetical protein KAX49_04810 [Halanaerobiales bacterium]|nr:hypothetical protein [Halanaerobiales bacterium]
MAIELNFNQLYKKIDENLELGKKYYDEENYQKSIEHFQKGLGTCDILNDNIKRVEILYYLGHSYQLRNTNQDYQLSEDCYKELIEIEDVDSSYYYKVQLNRAEALGTRGEYKKAISLYKEIHKMGDKFFDIEAWSSETYAYYCMGKYVDQEYFHDAIEFCNNIIATADKENNREKMFLAYHNLGHIFYELGENMKASLAFQDSFEYCIDQNDKHENLIDMALIFIRLTQYDLAWAYLDRAQSYFEKNHDLGALADCLYVKGKLFKQKGRVEDAVNYFDLALSGYREEEYYIGILNSFYELYELYRRINLEKADLYLEQYKFYLNYVNPMGVEQVDNVFDEVDSIWI